MRQGQAGFEWDDGNESELARHHIAADEVEQVFDNDPVWASNKNLRDENSTDQELAEYFQAHKDDPEEWGEAEAAPEFVHKRKSRDLRMKITVRFTPAEGELIRSEATRLKLPYSEVVRRAVQHLVRPTSLSEEVKSA